MSLVPSIEEFERPLRLYEEMAIEGAAKVLSGATELGIAINEIYTRGLWKTRLDEKGLRQFEKWGDYKDDLIQRLGISHATFYNYYTPAKIACGPTMGMTAEEYAQSGGATVWSAVKDVLEYNRTTGEITGVVGKEVEDVKTFVLEHIEDFKPSDSAELNLTPAELRKAVRERFDSPVASITYRGWENDYGEFYTQYFYQKGDYIKDGFMHEHNVPEEVLEDYKRRLHISIIITGDNQ